MEDAPSPIIGISHIDLSVTNRDISARWYVDVLGFEIQGERSNPHSGFPWIHLTHPEAGISMALVQHSENEGQPFSEFRCGLDHLSFAVGSRDDLEQWAEHLAGKGYEPPPIADSDRASVIVLRDPDNIQIELCALAPP